MKFHLYAKFSFEPWDWRNSVEEGIGGCETSQAEMARALAARGHEAISYAPIRDDCPRDWEGTKWKHYDEADFSEEGIWIIYRSPELIEAFDHTRKDQVVWLLCQDWLYDSLTPARAALFDRIIPLCHDHEYFMWKHQPWTKGKTWVTRNGIKPRLIEEVEAAGPIERHPYRMMYASSPDRGLKSSLLVYERVKEYLPDAELHCTYGFNNIDKLIAQGATHFQKDKDECLKLIEKTGATFHGRLTQRQLYNEWRKTTCLIYITTFYETGWITGLEAMALGAIPVFSPVHAQGENGRGIAVIGHPDHPMTIDRAAGEVVRVMKDKEGQDAMRKELMAYARINWAWEQFAWQKPKENWEQAAEEDLAKKRPKKKWTTFEKTADPGNFEAEEDSRQRWLDLKPGQVFIDLGCNRGSWSSPALEMGATVIAIDSDVSMLASLQSHAIQQGWGSSLTTMNYKIGFGGETEGSISLDQVVAESSYPFDQIDFIKIDIEGCELLALKGAEELLRKHKPRMMIEVHTGGSARTLGKPNGEPIKVSDITDFLASLDLGYIFQVHEREANWYAHLYAHVPEFRLPPGMCDNEDEVESRHRWLKMGPGQIMLDVGAADGAWTIAAAKQGATVYAIDPGIGMSRLESQVCKAGVEDKVRIVEAFASDTNGREYEVSTRRARKTIPGLTLDTLVMSEGLATPTSDEYPSCIRLIKIDVEGEEMSVLRGATGLLTTHKPDLMVEVHIETVPGKEVSIEEVIKFVHSCCQDYQYQRKMLTYEGKSYCHLFCTVKHDSQSER